MESYNSLIGQLKLNQTSTTALIQQYYQELLREQVSPCSRAPSIE